MKVSDLTGSLADFSTRLWEGDIKRRGAFSQGEKCERDCSAVAARIPNKVNGE